MGVLFAYHHVFWACLRPSPQSLFWFQNNYIWREKAGRPNAKCHMHCAMLGCSCFLDDRKVRRNCFKALLPVSHQRPKYSHINYHYNMSVVIIGYSLQFKNSAKLSPLKLLTNVQKVEPDISCLLFCSTNEFKLFYY